MTRPDIQSEKLTLNVTRVIRAPRPRVFQSFSSVEEMKHWFGPGTCQVTGGEMDFSIGGSYRLHMYTEGGPVDLVGTFTGIVPNEKLVYTWEWQNNEHMNWGEMLVTVLFRDVEGGTEVQLIHENFIDPEALENHRQGWDGSFDRLETALAG